MTTQVTTCVYPRTLLQATRRLYQRENESTYQRQYNTMRNCILRQYPHFAGQQCVSLYTAGEFLLFTMVILTAHMQETA